jgi:hypothetical protein
MVSIDLSSIAVPAAAVGHTTGDRFVPNGPFGKDFSPEPGLCDSLFPTGDTPGASDQPTSSGLDPSIDPEGNRAADTSRDQTKPRRRGNAGCAKADRRG